MFERKDNKKDALLDLDGRMATLNKRYTVVKDAGLKIQAMVAVRSRPELRAGREGEGWRFRKTHRRRPQTTRDAPFAAGFLTLCPPSVFEGSLPPALHTTGVHRGITRYASSEARPPARRRWRARAECAGEVSVVAAPVSMRERGARPAAAGPVRSLRTCRAARSAGQPSCQQRPRRPVARVPGSPAGAPNGAGGSRHPTHGGCRFLSSLIFSLFRKQM